MDVKTVWDDNNNKYLFKEKKIHFLNYTTNNRETTKLYTYIICVHMYNIIII